MLTARCLPANEWDKLDGANSQYLPPDADVLVVERDGRIIGRCSVMGLRHIHLEDMEIVPEERGNPAVFRLLLQAMRQRIDDLHVPTVFAGARTGEMAEMLARVDAKPIDMTLYVLPVGGRVL